MPIVPRTPQTTLSTVALVVACLTAAACRQEQGTAMKAASPPIANQPIRVDGSATLLPISRALAVRFMKSKPTVTITVNGSDTASGFQKLCAGEIEIAGASRPINADEIQACRSRGETFFELPVAFDSLSVVVSSRNSFATCLTVAELKTAWDSTATASVTRWSQIRSTLPDRPVQLLGPGKRSGTFDYFTLAINGAEGSSRTDYETIEDPAQLANRIAATDDALGYLGFAYYLSNKDRLKPVAIDSGEGCVTPSADSVTDETYQPLSRPIFIYASGSAIARPDVKAFAQYYLSPDNESIVREIGYVPLPTASLLTIAGHLDKSLTGTMFGGRGSVLGVTAAAFEDDERVRNALVR